MIRNFNYLITGTVACVAVANTGIPGWLVILVNILTCVAIYALVQALDDEDNNLMFSFIASIPFILYWTETTNEAASQNIWLFLATLTLCVSLPFIFTLLFYLWNLACEE